MATNPSLSEQMVLSVSVYLEVGPTYFNQLCALSALTMVATVFTGTGLALRIYRDQKTLWVFRQIRTESGVWIVPNANLCQAIFTFIFLCMFQGVLKVDADFAVKGTSLHNRMILGSLVWAPMVMAGWSVSWSLMVSPLFIRPVTSNSFDLSRYPGAFNIFFIFAPIPALTCTTAFSFLSNHKFNQCFELYLKIMAILREAETNPSVLAENFLALMQLGEQLKKRTIDASWIWAYIWLTWSIFGGILIAVYAVAFYLHHHAMSDGLNSLSEKGLDVVSSPIKSMKQVYREFLISMSMILFVSCSYWFLSLFLTCKFWRESAKIPIDETFILLSSWLFCIFGTMAEGLLLLRTCKGFF